MAAVCAATGAAPALGAPAPTRSGSDPCNGTAAFDVNNVITADVVDQIRQQNPGAANPDGTLDRTKITHALILASGHAVLQFREKAGAPIGRITFEFGPTDSSWHVDSTNSPAYARAATAQEDTTKAAADDTYVGRTFVFPIPTDVVSDGNYVARFTAFAAGGAELGRLCIDATVSNGQGLAEAGKANRDPSYEPPESTQPGFGFAPQPMAWFPAAEPTAAQRAGYAAKTLRLEFAEGLASAKLEREENLAAPSGLAGTASATGGSLATGTYSYKVTALNATGETLPSNEVGVPVTGPTGSVALSWGAVAGATGYRVYRGTAPGAENAYYTASSSSFTDTGAAATAGTPNAGARAKIWVDRTTQLGRDDWTRTHSIAGGNSAGTPLDPAVGNRKVWGPGYTLDLTTFPAESLPAERIRVSATDLAGKPYCGIYAFSAAANGSFVPGTPAGC
jgi:hypothetical protein